jgi:hypothetical protein
MNLSNRIGVSLVALLGTVAAIVILLVVTEAADPDFMPGGSGESAWFYSELQGLADFGTTGQVVTIVVNVLVVLVLLMVLFLEIRGLRRREVLLPISATAYEHPEGDNPAKPATVLSIEASSVKLLVERTGLVNRNIRSIRCRLYTRGRPEPGGSAKVVIVCYPRLVLGSPVLEVQADLESRVKDAVERLTGLRVVGVDVRARYERDGDNRLVGA